MANRLASATSPYLLQHADNPVDWWEWGPEAFEEACRRGVPVLLSVGYAACHWCHVMAHESFEDEATAALMNEHFVNVKVDREERPDVDAVYMSATTAMTGHGGWPMTVVLDHDGRPFFAGTYFPDQPRHGQPSFRQILVALADAWRTRRDEVDTAAGSIAEALQREQSLAGGDLPSDADLAAAVAMIGREYDEQRGGFGRAPKFPPSMVLEWLLRHAARDPGAESGRAALAMVEGTCEAMARGGMHDQLAGGFARYSVDADWVVPHFEKMLYDNALLLGVYTHWWRATGAPLAERTMRSTAGFLLAELRTAEGGFASALDADSEGVEGKFYAWTPAQLAEVLGPEDGAWAAGLLSVTAAGTFEHGSSTLQLRADPDDATRWESVRERLLAARATRVRPARDDKVVAAWNGLAIGALAEAGALADEPAWVAAAEEAATLLERVHLVDDRLLRVSRDGKAGRHAGVLEDYGCVAWGWLALAQATGSAGWMERAAGLLDTALELFAADDGGFHDTAADAETLVARPRDPSDNASPSGLSALVQALVGYAALTGSGRYRSAAEAALRTVGGLMSRAPRFAGWSLAAAEATLAGPLEVAVVGEPGAARDRLAAVARRTTSPGAVVMVGAPGLAVPLFEGRDVVGGEPAAYVCRGFVCERPVTDPGELAALLA